MADHISVIPGVCGGRPHIVGSRVRVQDVVADYEMHGLSPEEIACGYEQITLADVHATLAYYYERPDEIRGHLRDDLQFVADFIAQQRSVQAVKNDAGSVPS